MHASRTSTNVTESNSADNRMIQSGFFGDPPLLPGEDAHLYDELLTAVTETVKPSDLFETFCVRDIVYLQWDIMRYRRISANYTQVRLKCISFAEFPPDKDPTADEKLAQVFMNNIKNIECLDRMITTMEARRNAAYREIDRHRSSLGARLRATVTEIEDAEFREIEDKSSEQKRAA